MVSEKEFLEEVARRFQVCPLCGSTEGFKAKGRFLKVIECNGCKSQWNAVTMLDPCKYIIGFTDEGEHYLKILCWTKKGEVGKYFEKRPLPVEFWTDPKKCRKYVVYVQELLRVFEKLRKAPSEVCRIKVEDKTNIMVYGPSGDLVAVIMPSTEELDTTMAIADFFAALDDDKKAVNGPICFVLGSIIAALEKHIKERGEEFSVALYTVKDGKPEKVEKNTFYPSPPKEMPLPDKFIKGLLRCGVLEEIEEGMYKFNPWSEKK